MAEDPRPVAVVDNTPKQSIITKYLKLITIEPVIVCWLLPFLLTYSATENILFEKGCRGFAEDFDKDICKIFVRKDDFQIECDDNYNVTSIDMIKRNEIESDYPEVYKSIENNFDAAMNFLCQVEEKVQTKISAINSIRNPISAIGPLVIILFAGPWSDKKNLRVPCMIVPFLGEAIGYLMLFISAIFINGPVEFPAYAYRLIPSLTGAESLMTMAVFSYLSAISTEEDRTFRFGLFQILMTIVPIIAQSLSPTFNDNFEYAQLFGMMIPVHIIGLIYTFVYLKEVKEDKNPEDAAYDNPAMEKELPNRNNASTLQIAEQEVVEKSRNFCMEFFDPRLAKQCITCFLKKREYGARSIIVLLMLMHFIVNGVANGETQNMILYQRAKLNWDISTSTYHIVFSIVAGLIGTLLAVGVLSKYLKIEDIVLTILSTILTVVSRFVYFLATTTAGFFTGTAIDFTFSVKLLTVRSIVSKIVSNDDLSTMFAVMGLFEAGAGVVFPYIYPTYYQFLLSEPTRDISEMFMLSAGLMLICLITYSLVYKLLKTKDQEEEADKANDSTKL